MSSNDMSILGMVLIPAACMIIIGLIIQFYLVSKKNNCNSVIKGTVISYNNKRGICEPEVEFSYNGSRYYSKVVDPDCSREDYPRDSKVDVYFNPKQPTQNYAVNYPKSNAGLICIFTGLCIAVILGGSIVMLF